jgi:aryl-alcohol dehydrogenase-like predicted oxidoreductase
MQYARLGDTGLIVSRLAFGAMTFGTSQGIFASVSKVDTQPMANDLVARALDAGINHFNTADVYTEGQSEQMLGKALGSRRKHVVISTKVAGRTGPALLDQGLSRHHILASAENSLRRLATDYIDIYLVHRVDLNTPVAETLEALDTLARTARCGTSDSPIGTRGARRRRSACRTRMAGRASVPQRCTTRWWGGTSSTR